MAGKKHLILLVEDEQMIVDMYKLRLEEESFEVLVTDQGTEALEIASKKKPKLILLDIILPEVDGFSILMTLKSQASTKSIPVVMLTNLGQESDQAKGQQMGAVGYFVKSQHTPTDIIGEIKKIIK